MPETFVFYRLVLWYSGTLAFVQRISAIAILILISSSSASAKFSASVLIKNSPQAQGRYFDPHNHFNGVLPYRVFGGISQTGQREIDAFLRSPQGEELKRLLPASDDDQARARIAEYLAHHASWLATTYTNAMLATYLTGDFQLAPKGLVTDECAKILEGVKAHFASAGEAHGS